MAPVLDRDEHYLPRQGVGWLDLVRIRQCREERLAAVVDLEERRPVRRAAREKTPFGALCRRRVLAMDQEIPRHARLHALELAADRGQEPGMIAQPPVEHRLVHRVLM